MNYWQIEIGTLGFDHNHSELGQKGTTEVAFYLKSNPKPSIWKIACAFQRFMASSGSMKTGRNDACPCGSGKKYKKCCLLKDDAREMEIRQQVQSEGSATDESSRGSIELEEPVESWPIDQGNEDDDLNSEVETEQEQSLDPEEEGFVKIHKIGRAHV